jgi:hypothetical protein
VFEAASCPLNSYRRTTCSYDPECETANSCNKDGCTVFHATNHYYDVYAKTPLICSVVVPSEIFLSALGKPPTVGPTSSPQNYCWGRPADPGFGYALDVAPNTSGTQKVFLPRVQYNGRSTDFWQLSSSGTYSGGVGSWALFRSEVDGMEFRLALIHLAAPIPSHFQDAVPAGTCVGGMIVGGLYGEHLHTELAVSDNGSDYTILKPENYMCN